MRGITEDTMTEEIKAMTRLEMLKGYLAAAQTEEELLKFAQDVIRLLEAPATVVEGRRERYFRRQQREQKKAAVVKLVPSEPA
jgi:hypothetical protein